MKLFKNLLSLTITCFALGAFAQPGQIDCHYADYGQYISQYNGEAIASRAVDVYESGTHSGKFVTANYQRSGSGNRDLVIYRFNADGTLDNTWGTSGVLSFNYGISTTNNTASGIAVLSNDKVVVVGYDYNGSGRIGTVALINSNGTLDTGFDSDGKKTFAFGSTQDYFYDVAPMSDGSFVIAYRTENGTSIDGAAVRINQTGGVVWNTAINWNTNTGSEYFEAAECIAVKGDTVYVGGWSGNSTASSSIAMLNSSGALITSFDGDGKKVFDIDGTETSEGLNDIEILSNGDLILASDGRPGGVESMNVVKMGKTGTLDTSFDGDGIFSWASNTTGDFHIYGVEVQSDGKILGIGYADTTSNVDDYVVFRLNTNGALDASYGTGGVKTWDMGFDLPDQAYDAHLNLQENLIVVGHTGASSSSNVYSMMVLNDESETQTICAGIALQDTAPAILGDEDIILEVVIHADGDLTPYTVSNFAFNTTGTTSTADITEAKLYYTGLENNFSNGTQVGSTVSNPDGSFNFNVSQAIVGGPNHYWLVYKVASGATAGNDLDAQFTQFTLSTIGAQTPAITNPSGTSQITDPYSPKLYWADSGTGYDHIMRSDTSGANSIEIVPSIGSGRWLALDLTNEKLYIVETSADLIYTCDLDGSNLSTWKSSISSPGGIAIDNTRGKVYWSDNASGVEAIYVADLDGSNTSTLTSGTTNSIAQLSIDEKANDLYIMDSSHDAIYKYDIDGSSMSTFKTLGGSPDGVFADTVSNMVYWSNDASGFDHIKKSAFDGTGETTVYSGLNNPKGIWIFDGKLYYGDSSDDGIFLGDINGGATTKIYNPSTTASNIYQPIVSPALSPPVTPISVAISSSSNPSCFNGNNGSLTATASDGTTPHTYLWSTGASTSTISGLSAGTYTTTVTDAGGITATASSTLTQPTQLQGTATTSTNVSCNGGSDGSASISGTGGSSPYTYSWSNGATSSSVSSLSAGTYTVTITDANGCTLSNATSISQPTQLQGTATTSTNVSCNGGSDGSASISGTGGSSPYTYSWSNGATSSSVSSLSAGTYTVTITDANGCTLSNATSISQPTQLQGTATTSTNVSCNGGSDGSASISGTGGSSPYTYSWSNGATNSTASSLAAGTYTVTITDANGCTLSNTTTVTEPTAIGTSITAQSNVSSNGGSDGSATAAGSGGTGAYTYSWNNGATTAAASSLSAGTYTVSVTDGNGCGPATTTVTITEPAVSVAVSISAQSNVSCNGSSDGGLTASASSGTTPYTYAWSNGATSSTINGLFAGTYTITVTDAAATTATASATITQPTQLQGTASTSTNVSCNGGTDGSASISGTGGSSPYTYSWSNGATNSTASSLAAGTYTVTITDANGCTLSNTTTVTEPTAIGASITAQSNVSSNGGSDGSATAAGSGGTGAYTYSWNNGATTATVSSLSANTYTVSVTDGNGCGPVTTTVTITEPSAIVASIAVDSNVSCNGGSDGGATASGSGGSSPYTYLWSNSATSASVTGVTAGTYTVTVTDNSGTTATASGTITQPTQLQGTASTSTNVSCNGGTDGSASISGTGGSSPYTYSWSNGATSSTASSLAAGTYTVTITDNNGCTLSNATTVTEPTALVVSITAQSNVSSNGGSDGSATAAGSGGTGVYTYSWNNGATTATVSSLSAGTYTVSVTDGNGCGPATTTATITEPAANLLASMAIDSNVTCNGGSDGGATASASGGSSPYTYFWSNSATTASITGVTAGTYTVTVTDNNGISATANGTITQGSAVQVSPFQITQTSCAGNDGSILVTGIGGVTPYTYNWSNSDTGSFIGGLVVGNYMVTVSDANGCTDVGSYNVTKNFSACNVVTNLRTHFIQDVSAVYRWDTVPNAKLYKVVWKVAGTNGWTNQVIKHVPNGYFPVSGLSPSTSYVWSVMVKYNSGEWSGLAEGERFTTLASPCLNPLGLTTSPVQGSQAKLNWTTAVGAKSYRIRYRAQGAGSWNQTHVSNGNSFKWITGLNTSTTYEWEIKSVCNFGNSSGNRWSATQTFTTGPNPSSGQFAFNGENQHELTIPLSVSIYPNPNQGNFKLIVEGEDLESARIKISNLTGVSVFEGRLNTKGGATGQIEMNGLAKGVYLVSVISNSEQQFKRIIVQ